MAEDKGHPRRELQNRDSVTPNLHEHHSAIEVNNHFSTDNGRYQGMLERGTVVFDTQQFHPTRKANNYFFADEGRNYIRPPVNQGEEIGLNRQQNFQSVINANNHFIEQYYNNETNQKCGFSATSEEQAGNGERVNANTTEMYATMGPQREPSYSERAQSEGVVIHIGNQVGHTENIMGRHDQCIQNNPNECGQTINNENCTNQNF